MLFSCYCDVLAGVLLGLACFLCFSRRALADFLFFSRWVHCFKERVLAAEKVASENTKNTFHPTHSCSFGLALGPTQYLRSTADSGCKVSLKGAPTRGLETSCPDTLAWTSTLHFVATSSGGPQPTVCPQRWQVFSFVGHHPPGNSTRGAMFCTSVLCTLLVVTLT